MRRGYAKNTRGQGLHERQPRNAVEYYSALYGFTQAQLARIVGLPRCSIKKFIDNTDGMTLRSVLTFSEAMGINPIEFFATELMFMRARNFAEVTAPEFEDGDDEVLTFRGHDDKRDDPEAGKPKAGEQLTLI